MRLKRDVGFVQKIAEVVIVRGDLVPADIGRVDFESQSV